MKGYWNNARATANTLTAEGYLRKGDIAYVDDKGLFFIVDRMKKLIKVEVHQVAPAELEALLLEHEAVADIAMIGIQTPDGHEQPRAYVVLKPKAANSQRFGAAGLRQNVSERVAKYKRLTGGIEFLDAIPRIPAGTSCGRNSVGASRPSARGSYRYKQCSDQSKGQAGQWRRRLKGRESGKEAKGRKRWDVGGKP